MPKCVFTSVDRIQSRGVRSTPQRVRKEHGPSVRVYHSPHGSHKQQWLEGQANDQMSHVQANGLFSRSHRS